jgi:WD40 repeat protein
MFYETEGLKLKSQIHVRSSRGKNARGSKITGIQTMTIPPPNSFDFAASQAPSSPSVSVASTDATSSGEVRVLITSNDSRIRIYSLRDKTLDVKLKGHENLCSQIAATFSDDGKHVICGSEDRKAFIWSLTGTDALVQDKDKAPCECFEAHGDIVTTALFAPTRTRMLLSHSGDPIYDLCNPPPVVLQSLEEAASAATSQVALTNDLERLGPVESKRPEPSPAYIARSTHYDGHIIVTTGDTGIIKVFRQDCAFAKRRHESWETGSLSRKLAAHGSGYVGSGLGRSGSVLTRTSAGSTAHSRRGSLSQPVAPGAIGSPQLAALNIHPDRILTWRQGIENGGDRRSALLANGGSTPARSLRSISPTKGSRTSLNSAYNLASEARKQPYAGASPARHRAGSTMTSPTTSVFSSPQGPERLPPPQQLLSSPLGKGKDRPPTNGRERKNSKATTVEEPSVPPTPGFTLRSASGEDTGNLPQPESAGAGGGAGGSSTSSFWKLGRWRGIAGFRAGSGSGGQAQAQAQAPVSGGGVRARSSGSRPSLSKSRGEAESEFGGDGDGGEREAEEERETASRLQSMAVSPVKPPNNGSDGPARPDRHKLLPSAALLQQVVGNGSGSAPVPAVPVSHGGVVEGGPQLERVNGDGSPFRGHAHASRLGSP